MEMAESNAESEIVADVNEQSGIVERVCARDRRCQSSAETLDTRYAANFKAWRKPVGDVICEAERTAEPRVQSFDAPTISPREKREERNE